MDRMRILTGDGRVWVDVSSADDASEIGSYWNDIRRYSRTGDESVLDRHEGRVIDGRRLLTDPDDIDYLAGQGELEFEDIYEGDDDGERPEDE
jgi:hypothetical protein